VSGSGGALRCVVVVDDALPAGLAANAAAALALTLGATVAGLIGEELVDADGERHPGLIPHGLPVLAAPRDALPELRRRALATGLGVVDFPVAGQQTTDYAELLRNVAATPAAELAYLGLLLHGPRRAVTKLTGALPLRR
jgi:hypothetical protein